MKIGRLLSVLWVMGANSAAYAREPDFKGGSQAAATSASDASLVVTGEKSTRLLQDTPTSVAITTSRTIEDQGLTSAYDLLDRTPNVIVDGNRTTFSIRGVDAFNVSGSGEGALATVYVDGAAIPRLALASGPLDLYDVEQVEIFRGAQSTLQGRNALAGAVIINTADPSFDWFGKTQVILTDEDGQMRAGAAVGGPLADGQLAFRVVGETSRTDGLIHNVTTHGNGDHQDSKTLRGKLLLAPQSLPDLRIVGACLHDRHQRGTFYTELDPPYDPHERIATSDVQDTKLVTSSIATLSIGYDIAPGSSLKSITNYSRIRFWSLSDADRTAVPGQLSSIDSPSRTFQQEVRFNFRKSWIDGVIGAYYLRERRDYSYSATQSLSLASLGVDRQLQATGLPPPTVATVLDFYGGTLPIRTSLTQPRNATNHAVFADMTFPISARMRVNFGLRYDAERQGQSAMQTVAIDRPLPDPADLALPALAPVVGRLNALLRGLAEGANSAEPAHHVTYRAWLPKLGLGYDLAPNLALSLTVQRGYRAGGAGLNQQRASSYDYGPEFTTNYEGAVRSTWFRDRLAVNANAYLTDWKDQQVLVQLTPGAIYDTQVVNAGKSRLHGFEIEARGSLTRTLHIHAGVGYARTRFRDFTVTAGTLLADAQGKEFPRAPRWTVAGSATYAHPSGWFANANVSHRGAYYQDIVDQSVRDIRALTLFNARIGWQGRHFGTFLIARNILNEQKLNQFFRDVDGRRRGSLNDPRILGLTIAGRI